MEWTKLSNQEIEIRVDFDDLKQLVQYKFLSETEWKNSPFRGESFRRPGGESDALKAVKQWIEMQ